MDAKSILVAIVAASFAIVAASFASLLFSYRAPSIGRRYRCISLSADSAVSNVAKVPLPHFLVDREEEENLAAREEI